VRIVSSDSNQVLMLSIDASKPFNKYFHLSYIKKSYGLVTARKESKSNCILCVILLRSER
jgi:hypothetical protein